MAKVLPGRFTAEVDGDVTVFLIGMRFNKPWLVHKWLPPFLAMPRMLAHLGQHPEAGLLGYQSWFGRTTLLVSYWESAEHLQRFASDRDAPHLEAWRAFQRRVGTDGSVGVFHETYVVPAGRRETIYGNMPPTGLAAATSALPVGAGTQTARRRMERGISVS